jgi:hypothetical protein
MNNPGARSNYGRCQSVSSAAFVATWLRRPMSRRLAAANRFHGTASTPINDM